MDQIYHSEAADRESKRVQAYRFGGADQLSVKGAIAGDFVQWHITIDYEFINS